MDLLNYPVLRNRSWLHRAFKTTRKEPVGTELIESGFTLWDEKNDGALAQLTPDAAFPLAGEVAASVTSPAISRESSWVMDCEDAECAFYVKTNKSLWLWIQQPVWMWREKWIRRDYLCHWGHHSEAGLNILFINRTTVKRTTDPLI